MLYSLATMTLIADTPTLAAFCARLAGAPFVTVDTEFMRERTFWPKLCVAQVAGPDDAAAVDTLAPDLDLSSLFTVLAAPETVKVFHAGRQDLEIFLQLMERLPAPVFDTQIAAMVCGFGDQVGYETLVSRLARARLDKASRFTDWSARPLTDRQVAYALADVTHLRVVYQKLRKRLEESGRAGWLDEEMSTLTDPATYVTDPTEAWRRLRTRSTDRRFLAVLREVAAWREREAQTRDVPRNRLLRDEALVEIAHHRPNDPEALARTRGLGRRLAEGPMGADLLRAVAQAESLPPDEWPEPERREEAPRGVGPLADLLKVLLKMKCDEHDVAQKLVASAADVERIAADGEAAVVAALGGWRRHVFGEDALRLRDGRLALAADGRKVVLTPLP